MSHQNIAPAWANTRVSTKLGIKYPIIQGPLGGLVVTTADGCCLELRRSWLVRRIRADSQQINDVIAELQSMTDQPFAINLWVSMEDEIDWEKALKKLPFLGRFFFNSRVTTQARTLDLRNGICLNTDRGAEIGIGRFSESFTH